MIDAGVPTPFDVLDSDVAADVLGMRQAGVVHVRLESLLAGRSELTSGELVRE